MNPTSSQPRANLEVPRKRAAIIVGVALLVTNVLALFYGLSQSIEALRQGRVPLSVGAIFSAVVINVLTLWIIRAGRVNLGGSLLIGTTLVLFTGVNLFVFRDAGLVFGIGGIVLTSMIAGQILKPSLATRAIVISIIVGFLNALVDLYLPLQVLVGLYVPFQRSAAPTTVTIVLMTGLVLVYAFFLFRQFNNFSLRTKLIIVAVGLTSLSVLIVGGLLLSNLNTALRAETDERLSAETRVKAITLITTLKNVRSDISYLARLGEVENYARTLENRSDAGTVFVARRVMEVELMSFTEQHKQYDQVSYLDVTGREVVRVNNTPNGLLVTQLNDLQDKSADSYVMESLKLSSGEIRTSSLELSSDRGEIEIPHKPILRYVTPVVLNSRIYGMVVINVLAEDVLAPLGLGTSSAFLIDRDGYYLYHPNFTKRWGRELKTNITIDNDDPQLRSAILTGTANTFNTEEFFFSFTPVTLAGENNPRWYLVTFLPSNTALASLITSQNNGTLLLMLVLVGASLVVVFASRLITAPLIDLTRVAETISVGNLDARARTRAHDVSRTNRFYQQVAGEQLETAHTEDEIDILARTFNTMAAQLKQTLSGLEQRVSERTRDLAIATEVGQRASLIRDLETLLSESVELIRDRFDLYYVQIYLMDATGKTLVLRSGSGEVGKQLLGRSHRLAVGSGINGSAAASRQSVIVSDTATSPIFRPNPLLPDTRSEMAVPILIGQRVLGVLDLQSNVTQALNMENASVFLTLAAQIAIAIENIILFVQAEEARKETEAQARRLTQEGWERFLNAVDRSEQIGYTFETSSQALTPITDAPAASPNPATLSVPIIITGEEVGAIHIEGEEERRWTHEESDLIQTVAAQVARQIENLRLLTQAEQSRAEAELATRRLTREGWQDFITSKDIAPGYIYDLNQVTPLDDSVAASAEAQAIAYPLKVGYETIGELAIHSTSDESAQELLATVADQLSLHIENLRLAEQTQNALAETQTRLKEIATLNQISQAISAQTDTRALFEAVRENLLQVTQSENIYIALYDIQTKMFEIPFMFEDGQYLTVPPTPLGRGATSQIINTRKPLLIRNEEEAAALGMLASSSKSAKSYLGAPMIVGDSLIGVLAIQDLDREYRYNKDDMRFLETVASQIAVAVQNTRLFEQTTQRAERETIINTISQRIQSTTSVEGALEAATREIGQLLKAKRAVVEISNRGANKI